VSLNHVIQQFCKSIQAGNEKAVRELSLPSAWHEDIAPERLLRHSKHTGQKLMFGTKLYCAGRYAAAELVWYNDDGPQGVTWSLWCDADGLWRFAGRADGDTIARAYVTVGEDDAPTLDRWAGGSALQDLAERCRWAVDGNEQAPFSGAVWDEWTEKVEGSMTIRIGSVIEAPALARAMVVLEWVEDPDPGYLDTARAGILDYVDGVWELVMVRHLCRLRSMLDGLELNPPVVPVMLDKPRPAQ
jgi:hypothetical protein